MRMERNSSNQQNPAAHITTALVWKEAISLLMCSPLFWNVV